MTQLQNISESEWIKQKVKSLLSKRVYSKINNKIYCHHDADDDDDDDSYTENKITIEHVNDYCLAEILMYLPACERSKIALVCKKWKSTIDDSWFNVKKIELTHWQYDKYPNNLIENYPTTDGQFIILKLVLDKCGRYLKELDLTAYGHCNIIPVINESCPNLVKLRIRIEFIDDAILDNAFTGLSKLKVLKIIFQCFTIRQTYVPVTLINSLLNVADTLTELNLSNWSGRMENNARFPEEITGVVSELKALEIFQVGGINRPRSLIDYFTFTERKIIVYQDERKYYENNIGSTEFYKYIEKLDMRICLVTDDFLYNVVNQMGQLHTLQIYCELITDTGMVAISKINCLKTLDCYGSNNVTDSSIQLLKNIFVLSLPFSKKITDKSAIKVLENSPELYYFRVQDTGVTFEFIKKAEQISRNRREQLRVVMLCEDDMPKTHIYEYLIVDYVKKGKQQTKIR